MQDEFGELEVEEVGEIRTTSIINILAGIWLVIAPFVLTYSSHVNMWQEVVFGSAVTIFALARLLVPSVTWPSWTNVLIGLWFVIAPWTFSGTTAAARWNEVVIGIIVAFLSYSSIVPMAQHRAEHQH